MYRFFDRLNNTQAYRNLLADTRDKNNIAAFGVQPNEKPFVVASMQQCVLYVCSDYVEAQRIFRTVAALTGGSALFLPSKEDVLLYKRSGSKNAVYSRNHVLHHLLAGTVGCVVACVDALMQFLPKVDRFCKDSFCITKGVCYNTQMLVKQLVECGFCRVDGIDGEGEFVLRGDILDVTLPFGKRYRVDFFDDEVETIRIVGEDGKATEQIDQIEIYPLYETTGFAQDKLTKLAQYAARTKVSANAQARLAEIVGDLAAQSGGGKVDSGWLVPFLNCSTLWDYLPQNTTVVWDEPKLLAKRVDFLYGEHSQRVANLTKAGEVLPVHVDALCSREKVFQCPFGTLSLQTLPYVSPFCNYNVVHNFKTGAVPGYAGRDDQLATDVKNWARMGYEVAVLAGVDGVDAVKQKLAEHGAYLTDQASLVGKSAQGIVLPIGVEKGFVSHSNKLAVVGTRDLGRGINSQTLRKSKKQAFLSVEKGDYVVHDVHGIGLCEGIQKITSPGGETKDYIVVLYKNGDKLYVPIDATNMLSRYSGGEHPTLSRLGGEDFAKVKNKVKAGIKEMSINLIELYAAREKARGFRYHIDDYLAEEFSQYFPYKATEDQLRCHEEIAKDLTSQRIMDRVLVGDVGFGKTEVAMRAAFDVVSNGYQVAVLAPTTILAEQHYNTFSERMRHFDIKVACLNRFRSAAEQKQILKEVAAGKIDVLVGTHRLLSSDVSFAKLGLLVLDEEQRFGVEHKEKIKAAKNSVDVLTMSATPIPRTLHMALSGIRDISTITTPPVERMAVETFVVEENEALLSDVITRELARGGQVFCVYNKVESIHNFAHKLQQLVPNARIVVAHGQMAESALEDAVMSFTQGNGDVLVCTTIIENGIDIPNVNTLVVMDADRLGLSQLYQLRGRVGRSNRLAYAYFVYQRDKILNEVAYKRLSSITEYSELGSGFKIAMKDLEIRGAGNILGKEQHGHMVKVGYDMYARLLKQAVDELKGTKPTQRITTDIEMDVDAYAPDGYIPLQAERISFYQQLAQASTLEEIDKVKADLQDVYGVMPKQVANLFDVATLKLLANTAMVAKVSVKPGRGELLFANRDAMMKKSVFEALSGSGDMVSAASNSYSIVFSGADFLQKSRLLQAMTEFLQKIQS